MDDVTQLRRERDLLERLLDLGSVPEPEAFLREALSVAVARTGALRGHLMVLQRGAAEPTWTASQACDPSQVELLNRAWSRSVIAEALASQRIVQIANAMLDPQWSQERSVRAQAVEAVVCCPLSDGEPFGVLYLQGKPGGGPFPPAEVEAMGKLARWLTPLVRMMVSRLSADPTEDLRRRLQVDEIVGASLALRAALEDIQMASQFALDTLILGDTGTGKNAAARAIHRSGPRADRPFIHVNCGALHPNLLQAELFGTAPGAYTNALPGGRVGAVGAAEGGVLFIDEVGELDEVSQVALLQLLDSPKLYHRVGETKSRVADIQVIAATSRDLEAAVQAHQFRRDLWQRLNRTLVRLPSLAERREDIPRIAEALTRRAAKERDVAWRPLSPAAVQTLTGMDWPGNVRELDNVVTRGLLRAAMSGLPVITPAELFPQTTQDPADHPTLNQAVRQLEKRVLADAVQRHQWDVAAVLAELDISRATFYAKCHQYGLTRPAPRPPGMA